MDFPSVVGSQYVEISQPYPQLKPSDANSPAFGGRLALFASSPALPLRYINLPLVTSTINIEYLVKNKTDLVWDLAHF